MIGGSSMLTYSGDYQKYRVADSLPASPHPVLIDIGQHDEPGLSVILPVQPGDRHKMRHLPEKQNTNYSDLEIIIEQEYNDLKQKCRQI